MKLEYLREFYVLADYLNYTLASEIQYLTQPTLSKHIRDLEKELGVKLFYRTTRSVELTPAGIRLRDGLSDVFQSYDKTMQSLEEFRKRGKCDLSVGFPAVPVTDYLGDVPQVMEELYPEITLSFFSGDPESCIDSLLSGKGDLVLIANLDFPNSEKFVFHKVADENYVVLCRNDDPIVQKGSLRLEDLKNLNFIRISSVYNYVLWRHLENVAISAGFHLNSDLALNQMDPVLMAIRQGKGVTIVGKHQASLALNGLTAVEVMDSRLKRSLALAHTRSNFNPAINDFISVFKQYGYGSDRYKAKLSE